MNWEIVIGLETHVQLSTRSKIFSAASTAFGAEPNTQASAVDIALPGVLPVLNRGAVERAIRFGLAIGAKINRKSVFARKNYFYPDLPKGYQISQFELPVVEGGALAIRVGEAEKSVRLTRAHLEEDAGKSVHEGFGSASGIDLNRAGTPLLEIVSEPDMCSAAEAVAYAKALHSLVTWIGICDGNMQEGSFRVDANVSVRRPGEPLGTRREIKNLNSFRFLEQAIKYEARWQIEQLEDGKKVRQATVLFDPDSGETRVMRLKEDADEYRYFPDPDLPPLFINEEWLERVRGEMPELPAVVAARMVEQGLSAYDASTLTASKPLLDYFQATVAAGAEPKLAANWIMGEVSARLNREEKEIDASPLSAERLAGLIRRIMDGTLHSKGAKDALRYLWESDADIDAVIAQYDLKANTDTGEVEALIDGVLAANAAMVEEFKSGKEKAFNALVGQCMKAAKGKADPAMVNEILRKKLAG